MIRYSSKSNNLRNVNPVTGTLTPKKGKFTISKSVIDITNLCKVKQKMGLRYQTHELCFPVAGVDKFDTL